MSKWWKSLEVDSNKKIKIVAASYLNDDEKNIYKTKYFINSLLSQTFDNFELIIVHDGKVFNRSILDKIKCELSDSRITFVETEERLGKYGYPHRKKYAFLDENFDYLIYTNDDNFYTPHTLEFLMHVFYKTSCMIAYMNMLSHHTRYTKISGINFIREQIDLGAFAMKKNIAKAIDFKLYDDCHLADARFIEDICKVVDKSNIYGIEHILYIHN